MIFFRVQFLQPIFFLFSVFYIIGISIFLLPHRAVALDPGWSITAPSSVSLPSVQWSLSQQQTTLTFSTSIVVSSDQTTSNGFTAQVKTTEFIHTTDATLFIGYANFEVKTGSVTTSLPDGITAPINAVYTAFSGILSTSNPIDFMVADVRSRAAGSWTITPTVRLTIPAKKKVGTYNATMTFLLI